MADSTPDPTQQTPPPPPQSGGAHGFFSSLIGQAHESIAQQQANFELGRIAGRIELLKEQIKAEAETPEKK